MTDAKKPTALKHYTTKLQNGCPVSVWNARDTRHAERAIENLFPFQADPLRELRSGEPTPEGYVINLQEES